ncbi:hypothetical protein N9O57_01940, partial [bacterium]|nr:hypothetical protein [bacterium]
EGYKKGRREWLKKRDYKLIKFEKIESHNSKQGFTIMSMGLNYKKPEREILESSIYFFCDHEMYHIKSTFGRSNKSRKKLTTLIENLKNSTCKMR